jgi:hypothetical protein
MKKLYILLFVAFTGVSFGQASITALNTPYSENFDGMTPTGTTLPTNWNAIKTAGNAPLTMAVTDGASNSGNVYNVGTTASADRAFGSIASGTTTPVFGMSFINNTGNQVTELNISLRVEQWRTGDNVVNEAVGFSYSTDATSLSTGTWINVTNLNLNEILTTSTTSAAVDGNAAGNNALLNSTVNINTPWANGTTLWIKWADSNAVGGDSLLAIDDFSFKATSSSLSASAFSLENLKIFVNNNNLFVTSNSTDDKQVNVYNMQGKEVVNSVSTGSGINVSDLASGIYIVKVTENGVSETRKIAIK